MSSRAFKKAVTASNKNEKHFENFSSGEEIEKPIRTSLYDQFLPIESDSNLEEVNAEESGEKHLEKLHVSPAKKKKRAKKSVPKLIPEEEEDELDLEELEKFQIEENEKDVERYYFEIDKSYLDAEQELKEKMSGRHKTTLKPSTRKAQHGLVAGPFLKEWGSYGVNDLGFRVSMEKGLSYFKCTEEYDFISGQLQHLIEIGEVEGVLDLSLKNPTHIDALLISSDIIKNHSAGRAASLAAKSIYLLSKCINFFDPSLLIPYEIDERNRCIHLALFRHIQFLLKRGCWKTCFQVAKALFRIDRRDPLCATLILEFLGLQIEDYDFIQNAPIKSPNFELARLFIDPDESKLLSFLNCYPEAHYSFCKIYQLDSPLEETSLRMYYKNFFSLWSVCYAGQLWKNHPQKNKIIKILKEHTPVAKPEIDLEESQFALYRHQALIASDYQQQLRLGYPQMLLIGPIFLTNPFPPLEEWNN